MATRECLHCGMPNAVEVHDLHDRGSVAHCLKCDSELWTQTDGATTTVDIAHARETVPQALDKAMAALNLGWQGYARSVRLIVGGGLIRDAVLAELYFLQSKGIVLDCSEEQGNRGAVLVRIR